MSIYRQTITMRETRFKSIAADNIPNEAPVMRLTNFGTRAQEDIQFKDSKYDPEKYVPKREHIDRPSCNPSYRKFKVP